MPKLTEYIALFVMKKKMKKEEWKLLQMHWKQA